MGQDEQKEEREVLDSIFPDEITDVSESEYRLSIVLDAPGEGNGEEDEAEAPIIILRVRYPEAYPDVAPDLEISAPPNAPKHKFLDVQEDRARLLEELQPTIEENLGMAMVFALVSTLKESAEQLMAERHQAEQAIKDVAAAKAEEEENRKFVGTAVTRESFLEWRAKFTLEMKEAEAKRLEEKEAEDRKRRVPKEERRLTGKELWEKGMAGHGGDDYDDDDDGGGDDGNQTEKVVDEVQKLKVES